MPSNRDMSRSDKTKRPRMRLSPSDKSALQSADALIGPDVAREGQKYQNGFAFRRRGQRSSTTKVCLPMW